MIYILDNIEIIRVEYLLINEYNIKKKDIIDCCSPPQPKKRRIE